MKLSTPLVTLAIGAVLAGGLVVANVVNSARPETAVAATVPNPDPSDSQTSIAGSDPVKDPAAERAANRQAAAELRAQQAKATQDAPAPAAATVTWTYKGAVAGTDLTAAISVTGEEAVAYVCDGESVEIWLYGTATDASLDLAAASGETVTGTFTPDLVGGVFTSSDGQWTLSAASAQWPDWAPPIADGPGQA